MSLGRAAVAILREGIAEGRLSLSAREADYLDRIQTALFALPDDGAALLGEMVDTYGAHFSLANYEL